MTHDHVLAKTIERCRERNIIIPTFEQMADPSRVPPAITGELAGLGLWDLDPRNLFRITWKNEPIPSGGGFGSPNFIEMPPELTGVAARIFMLVGRFFPTGSHKVGATFGPLVSRLVRGQFDPTTQKALWPSTGNYCRGGAYDAHLLACPSIAVLPAGMSRERYQWLERLGSEIHATPGSESNVKEVFDKTHELQRARPDEVVVFNQFDEFSNSLWHYVCTGRAMEEVYHDRRERGQRFAAVCLTQGSAGTLGCADYLRTRFPALKVVAGEALQCPTLLYTGFGSHRIEGIGDKHVPWIHNVRNTDVVVGIDDEACVCLMRLFNEPEGRRYLGSAGVDPELVRGLDGLGISGIANLLCCVKTARYFEMTDRDVLVSVATDSMELYGSRLIEERERSGAYRERQAAAHHERHLLGAGVDHVRELGYWDRKRIHNLKYFTWVEQQGKQAAELEAQWYDDEYWSSRYRSHVELDRLIVDFNERTGLLAKYR